MSDRSTRPVPPDRMPTLPPARPAGVPRPAIDAAGCRAVLAQMHDYWDWEL